MKSRRTALSYQCLFISFFLLLGVVQSSFAQEKKNLRMVFVSLAWNSEIPFRVALVRGFFKQQGLQVEPILIRGGHREGDHRGGAGLH